MSATGHGEGKKTEGQDGSPVESPKVNWLGRIGDIAYVVQFRRELDQTLARDVAERMRSGESYAHPPETYAQAIETGLAQDGLLGGGLDKRHAQDEFRHFLGLLHAELTKA